MVFYAPEFIFFFCLLFFMLVKTKHKRIQKVWLLCANLLFYGYADYRYLLLLLPAIVINYSSACWIDRTQNRSIARLIFTTTVLYNLGVLAYFKYANFFIDNWNRLLFTQFDALLILLPLGLSFYTFQCISYLTDVYRKDISAEKDLLDFSIYISFFAQLIAGPIVRADCFLPQIKRGLCIETKNIETGIQIFVFGAVKKLLIADTLGHYSDYVFHHTAVFSGLTLLTAIAAFGIRVYCDFSGYSDMAVGLGRILGFDLPQNFNRPFAAKDIDGFWRRWHITLSIWFRDYVYVPLAKRTNKRMRPFVLIVTMALCGLWHGAGWNFIAWGVFLGIWQAVHGALRKTFKMRLPPIASKAILYTLLLISAALFRISSLPVFLSVMRACVTFADGLMWFPPQLFLAALVLSLTSFLQKKADGGYPSLDLHTAKGLTVFVFVIFALFFLSPQQHEPFIYFQF